MSRSLATCAGLVSAGKRKKIGKTMLKSTIALAVGAMLAPGLSAAPTIHKFIVDPNPTREHTGITGLFNSITRFFRDNEDSSLEKVVGYFTSITNPSVVNANGNGSGGVFLYVNNGSLSGTWTRHRIGDGDCRATFDRATWPASSHYVDCRATFDRATWPASSHYVDLVSSAEVSFI